MRQDKFAQRAARRLEAVANRLEEESRLGADDKILARAQELRMAAFMARDEAEAVTREAVGKPSRCAAAPASDRGARQGRPPGQPVRSWVP